MNGVHRNGPVVLIPVDWLPANVQQLPKHGGRVVLAVTERTGRAYEVQGHSVMLYDAAEDERYLRAYSDCELVHDDDPAVKVRPGDYKIVLTARESLQDMFGVDPPDDPS